MGSFSQKIDHVFGVDTYENTKKTYDWIFTTMEKIQLVPCPIESSFLFDIGKISCGCASLEEFVDNAYGKSDFAFIRMDLSQIVPRGPLLVAIVSQFDIQISASDIRMLESFANALKISATDSKDPTIVPIQNNYNIGAINGDNAIIVQGDKNKTRVNVDTKKTPVWKSWCTSILQNLLSNWIWYVLSILAGILIAHFM